MDPRRFFVFVLPALVAGSVSSVGCGADDSALTEIVLAVDTTIDIPLATDRIQVTIGSPSGDFETFDAPLTGPAEVRLPLTMGLRPGGSRLGPVTVEATAYVNDGISDVMVVSREAQTNFVAGERKLLRILLLADCVGMDCPGGETCVEGARCMPVAVDGASLPDFTSVPPPVDRTDTCVAGMSNAGSTVGCNGGLLGPFVEPGAFGGLCDPMAAVPCADVGARCSSRDGITGICLLPCDPGPSYVSTANCPVGSRCFDLRSGPTCFPDCTMASDCTSMFCDTENSCVAPTGATGDGGPMDLDAGVDAG